MKLLPVPSHLHGIHHDILGSHEGKLAHKALLYYFGIYHQAVHHIQAQVQDAVHSQEALRNGQPLIRRIVKGTLKPLCG